jgi:hypothetical protein
VLPVGAGAAEMPMCGVVTTNCVVSVEQNGAAPTDPFMIFADHGAPGYEEYRVELMDGSSSFRLDPTDTWSVRLNIGSVAPEQLTARGRNVVVERDVVGGNHVLTVTMNPVRMATRSAGCDASGCGGPSATADTIHSGYWGFSANDLAYLSDPDDRAAMRNFHFATSADWASTPPQLDAGTNTIVVDVANAHFESPAVPYAGVAEFRLPRAMLTRIYGVDDPDSLAASAFRASASGPGPAPTTTVTRDAFAVDVQIDGITFSKRSLAVVGKTWPRAPADLRAERRSGTKGLIRTDGAKPRGSKVRGYQAVCRPGSGAAVRAATTQQDPLPVKVTGLTSGKRYECTVRARSRAGLGVAGRVTIPRS